MFTASLLVLGSCTEQELTSIPVQTGDEINFGISTPDKVDTRTEYGTPTQDAEDNWYFPVYWEQDDEIAIYCPQASQPASQLVNYKITPNSEDPATSSAVTKVDADAPGLQWGTEDEHRFYGFYPASAVKGKESDGRIKGSIPVDQKVVRWDTNKAEDGTITYNGVPDTDLAYMFAYTSVKKSELVNNPNIPLKFRPLVTILEIIVNGPAEGGSSIQVSNINVTGVSGNVALAGDFECLISDQSGDCTPLDNSTVTNRISISCFDNDNNKFITLEPGDKINVKAFIIPNEESIGTRQISITVSTINGAAKTKTLQTAEIVPHKVNRVSLPALTSGGTNYWLSNLDPNIYLSELSLPGSKMSFSTKGNDGTEKFQTQSLETQFLDGVRAFVVQTNANTTYNRTGSRGNYTYTVTGATVNEMYTGSTLESILSELKTLLDEAQSKNKKNEFAFVQITYNSASSSSYYTPAGGAFQYWIEGIEYELNRLTQNGNKYNIYTDQITPDTKLGDVGGHIVLKVNYNDGQTGMGQYIDANAKIPALFSTWTKGMDDVALYWGSPNSNQTGRPEMHWYYSEATHIGNTNEAADLATKKNQISTVFQQSVDKYINGTGHNYWFMNDIGGCYSSGNPTIPTLTADLNNYAVQLLQERTQNASLGIVLLNYADKQANSGALYQSDWLIQTIIDNNFKFALRKASDTTNNTTNSDASYISGGSVIK